VQDDPVRRQKEIEQLQKNIANSERQLNDPVFMSKAPAKVIETIRAKLADYKAQLEKLL
jgi:valyl-tRNA synthetase